MRKSKFKKLFERYIEDGFEFIDIRLINGMVIGYDINKKSYELLDKEIRIKDNTGQLCIEYADIKRLEI